MTESNSYRTILRSSSIVGGASVVNVLVGLLRNKTAAVLLGPSGLGLIGLLLNLMQTAVTIAALGFGTVGTRQVAQAAALEDQQAIYRARQALFWGTLLLSLIGAAVFFLLRDLLAAKILRNQVRSSTIGWLSLGVFLSVASGSQQALLNGLRRIGDLGRIQVGSALLSTLVGIAALLIWGERGIILFILAAPLTTFVLGHVYVRRLPRIHGVPALITELSQEWRIMARLGFAFMISALVVNLGNLTVRTIVQRHLGAVALGQFQASWAISMTYISFVLSAMGTDYYPRLTGVIDQLAPAVRMVNEQTEVALLLAGPILIAMLGTAPWVIHLLYSSQFAIAADILRWQVLGDILKIASWPLGFVLLAAGAGRKFLLAEMLTMVILVLGTLFGLTRFGVLATGLSFALMYAVYLPVIFWFARRRIRMSWTPVVKRQIMTLIVIAVGIIVVARYSELLAAGIGLASALVLGVVALRRLASMAELSGPIAITARLARKLMRPSRN